MNEHAELMMVTPHAAPGLLVFDVTIDLEPDACVQGEPRARYRGQAQRQH
jgi:hypothetical protein